MNLTGVFIFAAAGFAVSASLAAADAANVDYTRRNEAFVPAPDVRPEKRAPEANRAVQDRRVTPSVTNPAGRVPGDTRAAVDLSETRDKRVVSPEVQKPTPQTRELSPFDHRESRFKPDPAAEKPKLVTRYQDAMTASNATTQKRSPAPSGDTKARINRFVFQRAVATPGAPAATPAGGRAVARPEPPAAP